MSMSGSTVFWHRKNLYRKFAASTRSQLIQKIKADVASFVS